MYKGGEYIVCLPEPNKNPNDDKVIGGSGFNANYCYRISSITNYTKDNFQVLWNGNNGQGIYDNSVRYATFEEIEEYERINKPFDTSTMNRFILPENWHILVTEENAEDVLKWRFESSYSYKDKADYSDNLVGIAEEDNCYHKGHNPKTEIIGDTYDFGIEITYQQFKKYVLNQSPVKHKYLTELLEKLKIK
jgi:hypothetical protein